jgi:large subunit ribosomal protein L25
VLMKLQAEVRNAFTSSAIRKVREENKVPAVVYGKKTAPVSLALDHKAVVKALHNPNALIELEVTGQSKQLVLIHAVQRDPLNRHILAIDLHQVDLEHRVKAHIHIEPIPDPDGKNVPYQMFLHEIYVDCLPNHIPASIPMDLTALHDGKAILVKDLPIPEEVHLLTRSDEVVASPFHAVNETEVESAEAVEAAEATV